MGKHNSEPFSPTRRRAAIAGGSAVVLVAGGIGVSRAVSLIGADRTTCPTTATVQVATTPELYTTVLTAANAVEDQGTACASYDITARGAGETAKAIEASEGVPDVWIPDSPIWVDNVNAKLGAGWLTQGETLATSPVAIAVPASLKNDKDLGKPLTWPGVLDNKLPLTMINPDTSSASLAAVVAGNQSVSGAGQKKEKQALLRSYLRLSRSLSTQESLELRAKANKDVARIFPLSEQQLTDYNKANQPALTPLVPTEGAPQLTYSWTTPVRATPAPQAALDALRRQLTSPAGKKKMLDAGFRVPGSRLPTTHALPASVKIRQPATASQNQGAQQAWDNLSKDARMLVVLDVSGSMLTEIQPGESRIDMLVSMCRAALDALPPTTAIGAWAFSTNLDGKGKDYKSLVSAIEPIEDTPQGRRHKADLRDSLKSGPKLAALNGDTGLYDTVAAAYKRVHDSYDSRYINSVVVMTDGKNDDPDGGLNLTQVLSKLRGMYDPKKPVKIVTIGIGDETDPKALQDLATATDGLSYVTKTPDQITSVFVDAFLRRGK